MTPDILAGWTLEAIHRLVAIGIFESRTFDFKEAMPHPADEGAKIRFRKTIAAFANASGGFLVLGVRDDRALQPNERVVGLLHGVDLPQLFGAQAARLTPAVEWTHQNPPHRLQSGNLVHVIEIHIGRRKPHGLFDGERWIFPKRTEGGNELLSYEEIRDAFRDQQAVRAAVARLKAEADRMRDHAERLNVEKLSMDHLPLMFRPAMLEASAMQVLGYVGHDQAFVDALGSLRGLAAAADQETASLLAGGGNAGHLRKLILRILHDAVAVSSGTLRLRP